MFDAFTSIRDRIDICKSTKNYMYSNFVKELYEMITIACHLQSNQNFLTFLT